MTQQYEFVGLERQEALTPVDMQRAQKAAQFVQTLIDRREEYITQHGLERDIWSPAANWHSGQPFYKFARELLKGNPEVIELLRIYSQQFSGYALWLMSQGPGTALPPLNRREIEQRLETVKLDELSMSICERLGKDLPEYLRISPPIRFGEIGWRVNGTLLNYDVGAYWERLLLLYRFGFLNRSSPKALRPGSRVLEIGGGYGALAWYIQQAVPNLSYTIVDLPESLVYSAIYLSVLHPDSNRFLANYQFPEVVRSERFDLVINTLSMSEMTPQQVRAYCQGIQKLIVGGGAFFEQNQDNRSVGMINAQDIIREYLREDASSQHLVQGDSHVWRAA